MHTQVFNKYSKVLVMRDLEWYYNLFCLNFGKRWGFFVQTKSFSSPELRFPLWDAIFVRLFTQYGPRDLSANYYMQPATKDGKIHACNSRLVLVLLLIGWKSCASFTDQSQREVKHNQSKRELLSTLNWKPFILDPRPLLGLRASKALGNSTLIVAKIWLKRLQSSCSTNQIGNGVTFWQSFGFCVEKSWQRQWF